MQELYFHVGLAKNASTFLQERFFPKLKNIHYTPSNIYRFFPSIVRKGKHDRYLFSREFDRQFYTETEKIASLSKNAKIIIVLRRHDSWIASQYRRYVKNGGKQTFEEFIDLEEDKGFWKQKDVYFAPMLEYLLKNFNHTPLILFYDDLKKDNKAFLDKIANYLHATYDYNKIDRSVKHSSYSEKQLYYIRKYGPLDKKNHKHYKNRVVEWFSYRYKWLINHIVLYIANLLPDPGQTLVSDSHKKAVRNFYQEDWEKCLAIYEQHRITEKAS